MKILKINENEVVVKFTKSEFITLKLILEKIQKIIAPRGGRERI